MIEKMDFGDPLGGLTQLGGMDTNNNAQCNEDCKKHQNIDGFKAAQSNYWYYYW